MKRSEGIAYLTQCADRQGIHWYRGTAFFADECPSCDGTNRRPWAQVPCSRYGRNSQECAEVAWRLAYIISRDSTGGPIDEDELDSAMSLVVNDHDDVAYIIREYGNYQYR